MTTMKEYRAYVQDNPKGYWFKARLYGWGWTPVRWQGWVVILGFLAVIILNGLRFSAVVSPDNGTVATFLVETFLLVAILIAICAKTGEKPRWQWGVPDAYKEKKSTQGSDTL